MGSGPSREDIAADTAFAMRVQEQQRKIQKDSEAEINAFFATVDDMVSNQGAAKQEDIANMEKTSTEQLQKVEDTKDKAEGTAPATAAAAPTAVPDPKQVSSHQPKNDVIVFMNVISVMYQQTSSNDPVILKGLVDTVQNAVLDLLGQAPAGAEGAAKENGALVPSALTGALTTLFAAPDAVKSITNGVASIAKLLLSALESKMSVSSSLVKKIQFVAPGAYCATYYSTSKFKYEGGSLTGKKTFEYSLSCGGMYLVTSPKLIQVVTSLVMYRQITESFGARLNETQQQVAQFTGALSDSAYFAELFGFEDSDYNDMIKNLKTEVMKRLVTNFWNATKNKSEDERLAKWNKWVAAQSFSTSINSLKSAYETGYNDLKQYYADFIEKPRILQH